MKFQLPQPGARSDCFARLSAFATQFDTTWPQTPQPAAPQDIAALQRETPDPFRYRWPPEYVWFAQHFGTCGLSLSFRLDLTLPPIGQNSLNHGLPPSSPYLFIGQAWIASPFLAYLRTAVGAEPQLVWVPVRAVKAPCSQAANTLEQLLFASVFLDQAYEEYPWKATCTLDAHSPIVQRLQEHLTGCLEDTLCAALMATYASVLVDQSFQRGWFSTNTDQFWFRGDTCVLLSRNWDADGIWDLVVGRIGSYEPAQGEAIAAHMERTGFTCKPGLDSILNTLLQGGTP